MFETLKKWDSELFVFLNGLGIEGFDGFWLFATQPKNWIPLFILFFILIFYYYRYKQGVIVALFLIATVAVTMFFTEMIKDYVARLRPNNVKAFGELIRILQKPSNYSFFSGHASSSFSIVTFVVLMLRKFTKWVYLIYLWPLIFAMSRIYLGVHYPSDIFVGALVGTVFGWTFYIFCNKTLNRKSLFNS